MRLVILGPQGSGKGTQAALLVQRHNLSSFAMGDALRAEVQKGTPEGRQIRDILDRGELVPNEITNNLIKRFVQNTRFIVDGYPRNLEQADFFDSVTEVDAFIVLDVPDEVVVKRLSGRRVCPKGHIYHLEHKPPKRAGVCDIDDLLLEQRTDDTEQAIRKRLAIYHETTQQVIDRYRDRVIRVNGDQPIEAVHREIEEKLGQLA